MVISYFSRFSTFNYLLSAFSQKGVISNPQGVRNPLKQFFHLFFTELTPNTRRKRQLNGRRFGMAYAKSPKFKVPEARKDRGRLFSTAQLSNLNFLAKGVIPNP
jgi:hypothetical protein